MAISVRSRREIDRRIDALRETYGEFPVHEETVENDPGLFEHGTAFFEAGGRGGAGARVTDDEGRVLLIRHPRDPGQWVLPAGGHEPGESFAETAVREVWEETGVDCELTGVWQVKRRRFVHREDPERRGYLLSVFFTAAYAGGEADRYPERWDEDADEEILDVEWFDELPENAAGYVTDPDVPERDAVNDS
ncbi:ADP-ribose pyrophosphatase [Halobacterium sp. DL1]|nr:ADP-ribose pyrophosphatase [Halobacterium sp. DL1]